MGRFKQTIKNEGNGQYVVKWKTLNRKNAVDDLILNSFYIFEMKFFS